MTGREAVYRVWGVSDWEAYLEWAVSSSTLYAITNIYADEKANGYRLPTIDEWLWAAMGADLQNPGQVNVTGAKKLYSGGAVESDLGLVNFAWCAYNSTSVTHEVGKKASNELGLFDMTGNVYEWMYGALPENNSSAYSAGESYLDLGNAYLYLTFPMAANCRRSIIGFRIAHNQ